MRTASATVAPHLRTFVLAAALAVAGVIHCLLTPEHMAMSAIFGVGFLAAGIAQFGMAALAVVRPSRLLYAAVIASTVVLSSTYAYNVMVGLPVHEVETATAVGGEADDESHGESEGHDEAAGHAEAGHEGGAAVTSDHHEAGVVLGGGEPVDAYGAVTQLAQLSAAGIAGTLLRRTGRGSA
jgi:hypothetical protein